MTVEELVARFPEIPRDLHGEPLLAELAEVCGDLLAIAQKPSACSTGHDAGNHFYLELIGPITFYGYGLATRERVLEDLGEIIEGYRADPEGFAASLLPEGTTASEVKGAGCE